MTTVKQRKLVAEFFNGAGVQDLAERWGLAVGYVEGILRCWRMKVTLRGARYVKVMPKGWKKTSH